MSYGLNIEMHKQVSISLFTSHNMNGKLQMQKILQHRKMHYLDRQDLCLIMEEICCYNLVVQVSVKGFYVAVVDTIC